MKNAGIENILALRGDIPKITKDKYLLILPMLLNWQH